MKSRSQSGFTLIEIAIVLVIIGLLLGGILKGQELINSARVRNLADQNSGVQAAYYGFIDRYRSIPGDMDNNDACDAIGLSNFPGNPADCDAVNGGNSNGSLDTEDYGEASALWNHLVAAGFIQGSYVGGAGTDGDYQDKSMAPVNAFNGYVMLTRTDKYDDGAGATKLGFVTGRQIPVNIMRELDVKVDDALPKQGVLQHTSVADGSVFHSVAGCVDTSDTPAIWDIEGDEQDCNAIHLY